MPQGRSRSEHDLPAQIVEPRRPAFFAPRHMNTMHLANSVRWNRGQCPTLHGDVVRPESRAGNEYLHIHTHISVFLHKIVQ